MPTFMRFTIAFPIAAVVTVGLFMLMRYLVIPTTFQVEEERQTVSISITRQLQDTQQSFQREAQRPQQLETPPPPPPAPRPSTRPNISGVSGQLPSFDVGLDVGTALNPDRDAQPLVRIEPRYPERAASQGREGWALVQFDVTPEGTVINAFIVESDPPGLFDRASLRAVERWRYQPKIVDGQPAPRFGVQTLFTFQLADE